MNNDFETLQLQQYDSGILQITLSRPKKLNALNATVLKELEYVFLEAKNNKQIKALLLTGADKAFCAGADISQISETNAQTGLLFAKRGQAVFRLLETLGKPSLAAVNGIAVGGGCELAMAATMRIAVIDAKFGQPEVKLGIIPGYGGTQRLARLVGKGRALELCITGRFITAETALQWGLISEVLESKQLIDRAKEILETILSMAPQAIAAVLDVIDAGYDMPLEEAMHLEATSFAITCATRDKDEGIRAFLEKRKPLFQGE